MLSGENIGNFVGHHATGWIGGNGRGHLVFLMINGQKDSLADMLRIATARMMICQVLTQLVF
jgi:hypothetical protein